MKRTRVGALVVTVLALFLAGCSQQLKRLSDVEPSYLPALRAEYLATYPSAPHNEEVKRGEVVKGMDILAVMASWGHPSRRSKQGVHEETWIYREEDEASKDWIEYALIFHDNVLDDWEITPHISEGRVSSINEQSEAGPLTRGVFTRGKKVPNQ